MRINSSTQELNWPENVNQKCLCPFVELKRKVGATDSLGAVEGQPRSMAALGFGACLIYKRKRIRPATTFARM